jgi:hypothetical protein
MKTEREFEPGQAPVYSGGPLPGREPWETFSRWGAPPDPPVRPGAYERPWDSPGPPPGAARERSRRGVPTWAVVTVAVGAALIVISLAAFASLPG